MERRTRSRRELTPHMMMWRLIWLTVIMAFVLVTGYGVRLYAQTENAVKGTYQPTTKTTKVTKKNIEATKPISILLMGTDTGALGRTDKGRTDTMIVATINPKQKRTTMVSIPRDTYVQIQGGTVQGDKINAAYTYNGTDGAISTVSKLLAVPINYYVLVNMTGLRKIVDAVGGVDVNVAFSWTDPQHVGNYQFTKGPMHLNGAQALAYARMRYLDPEGDYGRQKRQQEVIEGIVKNALSAGTLSNYSTLMKSLSSAIQTNLTFDEIKSIATGYSSSAKTFNQKTLKGTGAMVNGASLQLPSTPELQSVSDLLRGELGLSKTTLNNYSTKENAANANTFNFSTGAGTYTLY
ncbi:LCP family protein [Lacticaseibacillus nasuensis]|uniref:LCP family protein n=1 Tax=Lacticaseibacillus nasuensis TaxID=944671 RepID=UPI00224578B0|nr:LCP family protein [Lacticaseibacillus nasuensis]MCX2455947.1 LCP family protein [Lacticaseibacillus nasuensis]